MRPVCFVKNARKSATPQAAAEYYPASYWFSLMEIAKGPIPEKTVISTIKTCLQCHAIGTPGTRIVPKSDSLVYERDSLEATSPRGGHVRWGESCVLAPFAPRRNAGGHDDGSPSEVS